MNIILSNKYNIYDLAREFTGLINFYTIILY
jgi:hypothetical protein